MPPTPDPMCDEPDRTCPMAAPYDGAPCEGALMCDYMDTMFDTRAECVTNRWQVMQLCAGCSPSLAETCSTPFAGTLAGGRVTLGPSELGTYRAFADGERASAIFGAQGSAMIAYRVEVGGDVDPPACVPMRVSIALDGGAPVETTRTLALRCGRSLRVLDILPELPCEFRDYTVDVEVSVAGVGATTAHLVVMGGMCPRKLPG